MKSCRFICCLVFIIIAQSVFVFPSVCLAQSSIQRAVDVRLVTDEAEAVLAILAKSKANELITDADWKQVFQSEGYVRLKKRETSMKRSFEDSDFKTFVLSDKLAARAQILEETLDRCRAKLIESICDQRKLLPTYNKAVAKYNRRAREPLALWSEPLIKSIKRGKS